jgi:hypothetical protein
MYTNNLVARLTQTKRGEHMKKSISKMKRWQSVLESDLGKPIRNQQTASVVATLLDNQARLNKGLMLESAQVSSDVAVYQQYALPLVRRQFPELLAMNTVSVIPTTTPQGIYFALRYLYDNAGVKTNSFRAGQKPEIGYDLESDYTGAGDGQAGWSTSEGEKLSLYTDDDGVYGTGESRDVPQGSAMRTASIKVIKGTVMVETRAIKTHYTLELQQDLASVHGQDIESLMLEALQYEIQQEIDREILAAMKFVAIRPALGGATPVDVDLSSTGAVAGEWDGQKIAGGVANTILAVAQQIAVATRMGAGNFAICSPDVVAMLSTLNTGIYNPGPYMGAGLQTDAQGTVTQVGTLLNGQIQVYRDIFANASYALVGYKGNRPGESGIIFMPYIPYIFTKTAGQDDGSPRLIVKSRYAIVADLLGSGQFYRIVTFSGISDVIRGIDSSAADKPWQVNPEGGPTTDGSNIGGLMGTYCNGPDGDTIVL